MVGVVYLSQGESLEKIRGPNKLQKYAWKAIWEGADVVGVSASGKTTSYLLPLYYMLQQTDCYSTLPKNGLGVSFNLD